MKIVGTNIEEMPVGNEKEGVDSVNLDRIDHPDRSNKLGSDDPFKFC